MQVMCLMTVTFGARKEQKTPKEGGRSCPDDSQVHRRFIIQRGHEHTRTGN